MTGLEKMPTQETPAARPESAVEAPEASGASETPKAPETAMEAPAPPAASSARHDGPAPAPQAKEEDVKKVEGVLEEGLAETYKSLDPKTQKKFREEGERITGEIVKMMRKAKVKARKVLDLIRGWLRLIPHVNRHFLDQEAKIKTDRIMHLSEREEDTLI